MAEITSITFRRTFPLGPMMGEVIVIAADDAVNDNYVYSSLNNVEMVMAFEMNDTEATTSTTPDVSASINTAETPTVRKITLHDPLDTRNVVLMAFGS